MNRCRRRCRSILRSTSAHCHKHDQKHCYERGEHFLHFGAPQREMVKERPHRPLKGLIICSEFQVWAWHILTCFHMHPTVSVTPSKIHEVGLCWAVHDCGDNPLQPLLNLLRATCMRGLKAYPDQG